MNLSVFLEINPYVRMMRLKRAMSLTGKWRDIDNVFTYIASGDGDFLVDGNRYSLHMGNAILIPPYKTHVIISQGETPLVQYIIHFDFFESEERKNLIHQDVLKEKDDRIMIPDCEELLEQNVVIVEIPEAERNEMMRKYLEMFREFQDNKPGRELLLKSNCIGLLIKSLRCGNLAGEQQMEHNTKKTKSWVLIEKAINYIDHCKPDGMLDNDSIANAIGVTPNYLTTVFQEYLGMSLHKYIINYKLERAQQLLLSGGVNVTEAAEKTGFSSIHVFSKTFKSTLGISPSEFLDQTVSREQLQEKMTGNIL